MINSIIIDDTEKTVKVLKSIGIDFVEFSFKSIKENYEIVLNQILKDTPQIIFLNIESQKLNIINFLLEVYQYSQSQPYLIALSSSKESAYEAFKLGFSDFLLKPLNNLSVRKCILKYQKNHSINSTKTICLRSNKDYQYLEIDDILYLKADNNTTDFYMSDGRIIGAYKTLKVFENLLPKNFLRIHKSYIVNRNCVSRINYSKSICVVNKEHKLPFTKTFIDNIELINYKLSSNTIITLN